VNDASGQQLAVATSVVCIECRRVWHDPRERWRMYVTDDDPPEAVPYCDVCAAREFGAR
jgi:hypothetical protein